MRNNEMRDLLTTNWDNKHLELLGFGDFLSGETHPTPMSTLTQFNVIQA